VLLPAAILLNWRLAMPLLALAVVFTAVTVLVMHKAERMQRAVERHYSDLAETAADALGNVALVQSFARIEREVSSLKSLVNSLLRAQMPVLSWWAVAAVLTRAATTLTLLVILLAGAYLKLVGFASVGAIVSFMALAALLIARLEQIVGFANRLFLDAPKLSEFFAVLDTVPAVRDRPDAMDPGRVRGLVEFKTVSFSYDGKRPAVADLSFTALPGERIALVGPTGSGKTTALALLHRAFDPQSGFITVDGMDIRALTLTGLRHNIGVVFQETLLFNRSIADNLRVGKPDATDAVIREAAARAQALEFIEHRRARAAALRRRTPAPGDRPRAAQRPADPDPRRGDQRARPPHRRAGQPCPRRGDEGPHQFHHRASVGHGAQRHPHSGAQQRPHRRSGELRRAHPARRLLFRIRARSAGAGGRETDAA
jgi:ATP-binding cassette subfamily B protein